MQILHVGDSFFLSMQSYLVLILAVVKFKLYVEFEALFEKSHFKKESTQTVQTVQACATIMHFLLSPYNQCCGTVMICSGSGYGSGSDFGKVLVPVPAPVPVPDPDNI
jgi:hypothetical protein